LLGAKQREMEFTKCKYRGEKVNERMESEYANFTFNPEIGAHYEGEMKDGMFHGQGTIIFNNGAKIDGEWNNGILVKRKYIFSDGLVFDEDVNNWNYCRELYQDKFSQDRRFNEELLASQTPSNNILMDSTSVSMTSSDGIKPAIPHERQADMLSKELRTRLDNNSI
jgi:hypothetical protein